jgi:DNA helicase HerA-like ATPase
MSDAEREESSHREESPERTYLHIRPTTEAPGPETVAAHMRRLHQLEGEHDPSGLLDRVGGPPAVTTEWLLVSSGGEDPHVDYYVGVDDESALESLERILRGLFPDTYELERTSDPVFPVDTGTGSNLAAIEFEGVTERRSDWQTRLTPFEAFRTDEHARVPLSSVAETMANSTVPMVYQALLRPKPDWTARRDDRELDIRMNEDTLRGRLTNTVFGVPDPEDDSLYEADRERIEEMDARNAHRSFEVNARAAALPTAETDGSSSTATIRELVGALGEVGHTTYEFDGTVATGETGERILEDIEDRVFHPADYERLATSLPWRENRSRGIVADVSEVANVCLLAGDGLTAAGERAVALTPDDRTTRPRPPTDRLAPYRTDGMPIGLLRTQDGTTADRITLSPALQRLHVALFGRTGSGKSVALTNLILHNAAVTDGADILIDSKGDGMPIEYLRSHYALHGDLEDVYHFDCTELLPALSFFDIRDQLESGIDRSTAVEDVVDHYIEVLVGIMGHERFYRAVRSPDIIRYLTKALFDPIHGSEAFSHRDLQQAASRMHGTRDPPPVVDEDLQAMLGGIAANSERSFHELMQGVANRIEKVPAYERLGQLFNHVPEDGEDPHFDLREVLDEDAVVIIDTSGLRPENRRGVTLVLLSALWTALRRRAGEADDGPTPIEERTEQLLTGDGGTARVDDGASVRGTALEGHDRADEGTGGDVPLVNLYLEEAAEYATSGLLAELLSQGRGFGLSMTLAMQFPGQLEEESTRAYREVLNNVGTVLTGNVAVDSALTTRLATEDMPPAEVGNRLRALSRGEWLASVPAPFDEEAPRPFVLESMPLPAGHPEGDDPLSDAREDAFQAMLEVVHDRTRMQYGLEVGTDYEVAASEVTDDRGTGPSTDLPETSPRVDSALPYTERIPSMVEYDEEAHALVCGTCSNRYDPTSTGMRHAITCCHDLESVDRDDVPICEISLKLSDEERAASEYVDRQLAFLQAVYAAHQQRYDDLAYDIVEDSMVRLQEYVGIESEAIDDLIEDGLLAHDSDHPHRLYTVTSEGRSEIRVGHREGVAHGDGKGDLSESSLHVAMVEVGRRYLEQEFREDPGSVVEEVVTYHEIDEHRLDAAGLDADGQVVATLEAERVNHDINEAVPADYDKMAACDPEAAVWVTKGQGEGHEVLERLNDPADGTVRVEKTYSESTPPQQFRIDESGCTAILPMRTVKNVLSE